jgi:hypothetical protein
VPSSGRQSLTCLSRNEGVLGSSPGVGSLHLQAARWIPVAAALLRPLTVERVVGYARKLLSAQVVDGRWALYKRTWGYDYDGWWPRSDTAVGRGRNFCGTRTYRAVAHFHWLGASPGAQLVASGTRGIGRNC